MSCRVVVVVLCCVGWAGPGWAGEKIGWGQVVRCGVV